MHRLRFAETVRHRGKTYSVCVERGPGVHRAIVECNYVVRRFNVESRTFGANVRVKAIEIYQGLEALRK
jgi:hypothetical protein